MGSLKLYLLEFYLVLMKPDSVIGEDQSFTIAFMTNVDSYGGCNNLTLFFAATETTNCSTSVPKTSFQTLVFTVEAGNVVEQQLPRELALSGCGVEQKGIAVTCNNTIRLYGINSCSKTTDGFSVIPNSNLGSEYYAFTVSPTMHEYHSQVAVVSLVDNTTVTVHLRCSDCNVTMDNVTYITGSFISVMLNAYESLQIQSKGNLAGAYITSNYPVSVFSGNEMSEIMGDTSMPSFLEHLVIHMPPLKSWGKQFAVVPSKCDSLFLMASENFTDVNVTCTGASSLYTNFIMAGDSIRKTISLDEYCYIEANKPVLAVQTLAIEPSFVLLTPIDQYSSNYSFKVPNGYVENCFIYVIEESAAFDLMLDSLAFQLNLDNSSKKIPGTTLIGGYIEITDTMHHVTHPYAKFNGVLLGFKKYGMWPWQTVQESYAISLGWSWKTVSQTFDTTNNGLTSIIETTPYSYSVTSASTTPNQNSITTVETPNHSSTSGEKTPYHSSTSVIETPYHSLKSGIETPYQNSMSVIESPYHSSTSIVESPYQSSTSGLETPYHSSTSVLERSYHSSTSIVDSPYYSLTSSKDTLYHSPTSVVESLYHSSTSGMGTYYHSSTSVIESPYHSSTSIVESPYHSSTLGMGIPYHSSTSGMETPSHSSTSGMGTPYHSSTSVIESPYHSSTSIVESPYHSSTLGMGIPYHSSTSGMETPSHSSTSGMGTPYHSLKSGKETLSHSSTPVLESSYYSSTSIVDSPYHSLTSSMETPYYSSKSVIQSPYHSSTWIVESLYHSSTSIVESPYQSSTSAVESPYHSSTSGMETPSHSSTSGMGTPYHSLKSGKETLSHSSTPVLESSYYSSTSIVDSPYHSLTSSMETPYYSSKSVIQSPYHSSTWIVESPYHSSTSIVESPYQSSTSAVESPYHSWTSAMETPYHSSTSVLESPYHSSTSALETPYHSSTSVIESSYHTSTSVVGSSLNNSCVNVTTQQDCNCAGPCRTKITKWTEILNSNITMEELVKLVQDDFEKNIKGNIMVNRKNVSRMVRMKSSANNTEMSHKFIGLGMLCIVLVPIVSAFVSDYLKIYRYCRGKSRKRNKIVL